MCLLHSFGELWGGGGCLFNPGFSGFFPISYQPTSTTCLLCITLLSELSLSLVSQIHSVTVVNLPPSCFSPGTLNPGAPCDSHISKSLVPPMGVG